MQCSTVVSREAKSDGKTQRQGYLRNFSCMIWNRLWTDLEGENDLNDDHREEITDFVQVIPEFQECDEEEVETWMTCDAEDCGFQMLNDDEIVTSVQEESEPVDDETDEDESSKGPSNADAFSALETTMEWHEQQSECYSTQLLLLKRIRDLAAKKRRCTMVQRKISDYFPQQSVRFYILNGSYSVVPTVPMDSDKRFSTVPLIRTRDVRVVYSMIAQAITRANKHLLHMTIPPPQMRFFLVVTETIFSEDFFHELSLKLSSHTPISQLETSLMEKEDYILKNTGIESTQPHRERKKREPINPRSTEARDPPQSCAVNGKADHPGDSPVAALNQRNRIESGKKYEPINPMPSRA
ncbi:hypothetical protein TNCV_531291 [Trichonephila clavipes]|nr:hypothetical protein TNCV_531291 [Trichonephila clavipes]